MIDTTNLNPSCPECGQDYERIKELEAQIEAVRECNYPWTLGEIIEAMASTDPRNHGDTLYILLNQLHDALKAAEEHNQCLKPGASSAD
jgi:transcription initiation factor TFIIIB Brf1 subunit/transcription initiation factor TFIIB